MKKMFRRHLELILSIGMVCSLLIGFFLQIKMLQRDADTASDWLFWQIQQILTENQVESQQAKEEYRAQCLLRANAAAYIIQSSDTDLSDQAEMTRIAELLQVDELHIFDTGGTIIAGSEPKYFGYHFNSGEQMQFFLPMLADRGLELCQDVTPNTAEGKLMQYAAVWREDGAGIVQIGVTPARVLAAMEKTELSYIFSLLTGGGQTELCAADPDTYTMPSWAGP